jgi:hypothetical protein
MVGVAVPLFAGKTTTSNAILSSCLTRCPCIV